MIKNAFPSTVYNYIADKLQSPARFRRFFFHAIIVPFIFFSALFFLFETFVIPGTTHILLGLAEVLVFTFEFLHNYAMPSALILLSFFVVLFKSPINSLLSLILLFFMFSLLLLSLQVEFFALIFLIIYIGAVAVLFLFVIMIFNLKNLSLEAIDRPKDFYFSSGLLLGLVLPKFYYILHCHIHAFIVTTSYFASSNVDNMLNFERNLQLHDLDILIFSELFYTQHYPLFIIIGFILLNAMIGAIVVVLNTENNVHNI